MFRRNRHILHPAVDRLDDRCLLSGATLTGGLSPAQVKTAYGLNALSLITPSGQIIPGDGTGQTIAIVAAFHDPNLISDLHVFDTAFGLADPVISQVNLAGPTNTNDGWAGETSLDVEWAHAIAPGANLIVVEAASDSTVDLLIGVSVARGIPGVSVVSMSWGGPETSDESGFDHDFTTPVGHTGITYVAASGDTGATGGAQWPAVSPNVLSVGGTTLSIDGSGGYSGESLWSGSGRGVSRYEPEPAYQRIVQATGRRSVPDVSFLADPNTGVAAYSTNPSDHGGGWQVVGGTSLGTPAWAGIVAIINEGLAIRGQGTLNGSTQLIPLLYALNPADFHNVGNASNGLTARNVSTNVSPTGLGTPVGASLINDLVHPINLSAQNVTTAPAASNGQTTPGSSSTPYTGAGWQIFGGGGIVGTPTGTGKKKTVKPPPKRRAPKPKPRAHAHKALSLTSQPSQVGRAASLAVVARANILASIDFAAFDLAMEEFATEANSLPSGDASHIITATI